MRLTISTGYPDYTLWAFVPDYGPSIKNKGISEEEFLKSRDIPVLWLLHGSFGTGEGWFGNSKIELYAQEKGIALVAPCAGGEFYTNMKNGIQWEDIMTDKLWKLVHRILPVSEDKEKNYVCGVSMGGYGAMKLGLKHPDKFGYLGCFSGGVEIIQKYAAGKEPMAGPWHFKDIFGEPDEVIGGDGDMYYLADKCASSGGLRPKIYMCVGTKDMFEKDVSPRFRDNLIKQGFDVTWDQGDFGHEWRFWDQQSEKFINWLPEATY